MSPVLYASEPFTYPGGGVASGVQVRVYHQGTSVLAPLYHNASGTRALNPARTDAEGVVSFWVEPGDYDLEANGVTTPVTVDGSGGPGASAGTWLLLSQSASGGPGVGQNPIYNDSGRTFELVSVRLTAGSVTGTLRIDVNKNGATVFTDQNKRPSLTSAGTVKVSDIDVRSILAGDRLTVDVDEGNFANLVVQIFIR